MFALAATRMGLALRTVLGPNARAATLEAKINYFRPGLGPASVCATFAIRRVEPGAST